jgi:hypothetical protein
MMPSNAIYQAERTKSRAEQRAADHLTSEMAAALAELFGSLSRPFRALHLRQHGPPKLTTERRARRAGGPQRLDGVGVPAADYGQ